MLNVISRSPSTCSRCSMRSSKRLRELCEADSGTRAAVDGEMLHVAAAHTASRPSSASMSSGNIRFEPDRGTHSGRAVLKATVVHVQDVVGTRSTPARRSRNVPADSRAMLGGPAAARRQADRRDQRSSARGPSHSPRQIELVTTFADQAVIAIENVRLFEEVQARTAS